MGVARAVLQVGSLAERPRLVKAAVQQPEHKVVVARDDDQILVGQDGVGQPDEQPVLGRLGRQEGIERGAALRLRVEQRAIGGPQRPADGVQGQHPLLPREIVEQFKLGAGGVPARDRPYLLHQFGIIGCV